MLYVETFDAVCGDILCCVWRYFILYVETFCAVCGGAVCGDTLWCV